LLPLCVSQAVLKQFGGGYADSVFADEGEAQQHTKLEKLYISTRAAKVKTDQQRTVSSPVPRSLPRQDFS
jgi:hypothetical protein